MAKTVGIDLGTTNSVVAAIMEGGRAEVIPNAEGGRTTPSVVAFTDDGQRLVGQVARRQAILNPEATVYSAKRFIGRKWGEVDEESKIVSYKVTKGANDAVRFEIRGKQYAPEEISAQVLRKLADDAAKFLGEKVTEAVITVPAYFNDAQRQATKDAGRIAGLNVLRIINEPTAAALAYGLEKKGSETVLVFDLGGGTFDVSLLDVGDGVVEVRATERRRASRRRRLRQARGRLDGRRVQARPRASTCATTPQALQRLYEAAEKAKVELSSTTTTQINLPFITADASGPKHLNLSLSRSKFDQLTADLVERCRGPVEQALADAKLTARRHRRGHPRRRVDAHPGGAGAGAPADRRQGAEHVGQPRRGRRDRRRAAGGRAQGRGRGRGAARRHAAVARPGDARRRHDEGHRAQHDDPRPPHRDVLDRRGRPERGRRRGAAGRARAGRRQPAARPVPAGGHQAGAARTPQIEVTFDIDANGILNVSASDQATGAEQQVTIAESTNLDQSEIERMVAEAQQHAGEDKRRREEIDARNELDTLAYQADSS